MNLRADRPSAASKQDSEAAAGELESHAAPAHRTSFSLPPLPALGSCRTRAREELSLRHCQGMAEFEACVELQRQTWGYPDLEVTPRKAFLLAQQLGGQVIGAFDLNQRLVGFAMAMAALDYETGPTKPAGAGAYLHSHMLAVLPAYRDKGLGTRLKLAQREDALARGIERMTWTFDPLAAKNAYLNLHRLGAIVRRYSPDFYGVSSSRLQAGLPTDRLHAEWWLRSTRVKAHVDALGKGAWPEAVAGPAQETVHLPAELESWKQDPGQAARVKGIQEANRAVFVDAFARGLAVTDFCTDAAGEGIYQLESWHTLRTAYED